MHRHVDTDANECLSVYRDGGDGSSNDGSKGNVPISVAVRVADMAISLVFLRFMF